MSITNLYEAYNQVYDYSTLEFDDILLDEDLEVIEQLDDETLNDLVEEVISNLILNEECEIEDIEGIFEEVLSEARIDMAARKAQREKQAKDSESVEKGKRQYKREVQRRDTINRVKKAVKSGVERAKDAVKSGVDKAKEAGKSAKFHAVDKHVASYANKRKLHPAPGMAARSKDPEKRRALRSKVVGDLSNRAQDAMRSASNRLQSGLRSAGSAVKSAAVSTGKKAVGKAARGVAGAAKGVAKRSKRLAYAMGEDVDIFDVIEEHLIEEGYADTSEAAQVIMVNMSEDWREDILDELEDVEEAKIDQGLKPRKKREVRLQRYRDAVKLDEPDNPITQQERDRKDHHRLSRWEKKRYEYIK